MSDIIASLVKAAEILPASVRRASHTSLTNNDPRLNAGH